MLKKLIKPLIALSAIFVSILLLTACSSSNSNTPSNQINNKNYNENTPMVEDNADVLSSDTKNYIKEYNDSISNAKNKPQILVVTIKSLDGNDIADVATQKGKQYKIGSKEDNSGLVYVLAVDDHKDFLATGYGMEDVIPDIMAKDLLDNEISHDAYKDEDYNTGVKHNLERIKPYILGEKTKTDYKKEKDKADKSEMWLIIIFIIIGCPTLLALAFLASNDDSSNGLSGGGWSSGSSDGSSGGWSGGGGDFGGGGGGSSWFKNYPKQKYKLILMD